MDSKGRTTSTNAQSVGHEVKMPVIETLVGIPKILLFIGQLGLVHSNEGNSICAHTPCKDGCFCNILSRGTAFCFGGQAIDIDGQRTKKCKTPCA